MIHNSKFIIYTDGGARGNPGPAAAGVVIYDAGGKIKRKQAKFLGKRTNNEAEYEAVILALGLAGKLGASILEFSLDSELVVRQLTGLYRVRKYELKALLLQLRVLEQNFSRVSYRHIPREKNKLADELVNECLDDRV